MEDNNSNTLLIDNNKAYYTREERILYLKIMIDEFLKHGDIQKANYYKLILQMMLSKEDNVTDDYTK